MSEEAINVFSSLYEKAAEIQSEIDNAANEFYSTMEELVSELSSLKYDANEYDDELSPEGESWFKGIGNYIDQIYNETTNFSFEVDNLYEDEFDEGAHIRPKTVFLKLEINNKGKLEIPAITSLITSALRWQDSIEVIEILELDE